MSDPKPSVKLGNHTFLLVGTLRMAVPGTETDDKPQYLGWDLEIAGPAHPRSDELFKRQAQRINDRNAAQEKSRVNGKKWKPEERAPDEVRKETVEDVTYRILGWKPDPDFEDGKGPIAYSEENAVELFMDRSKGAFFVQLTRYLFDDKSFSKGSVAG